MKEFRDQGAAGALLDEYEKSIDELKAVTASLSQDDLIATVDHETKDSDCKSIQSILSHVVRSGYIYVIEIRKWLGEDIAYRNNRLLDTIKAYHSALDDMFAFNEKLFQDYPDLQLEAYKAEDKFNVRWGQLYDVEQIFEHAILHVMRHRRQIEKFLVELKNENKG